MTELLKLTLNSGSLSVAFVNNIPVCKSKTSRINLCCSPPSKPDRHWTSKESVVWLTTEQFVGASGGPRIKKYKMLYFNLWMVHGYIHISLCQNHASMRTRGNSMLQFMLNNKINVSQNCRWNIWWCLKWSIFGFCLLNTWFSKEWVILAFLV